ncbi:MAG: APC family permease [Firmicutes bacterium]|nr:APC family permease [Bacillota bacterium]
MAETKVSTSLSRNALGLLHVIFQSASQMSPTGTVVSGLTAIAAYALGSMPLAIVLALCASFLGANTLIQFSKRISSAGGYYTWIARGAGPYAGVYGGWLYVLYQGLNAPALILFFGYVVKALLELGLGMTLAGWIWWPFAMVAALFVWFIAYVGIKQSLIYSMIVGIVEIVVLCVLAVLLIHQAGSGNTLATFTPRFSLTGWSGIGLGMIFGLFSFAGYGASATLGEEAKNPHRSIARAILLSLAIIGFVLIFVGYATTVAWGVHRMSSYTTLPLPLLNLVHQALPGAWPFWFWALTILIINSTLTAIIAITNAQVRVLFALGRDRLIMPSRLGHTHPRYKTPHLAIHAQSLIGIAVVTAVGFWLGPFSGFLFLAELVTLSNLIIHIMANVSLIQYQRRIRQFQWVVHGLLPLLASLMFLFPIYFSIFPVPSYPDNIPPYLLVAWLLLGGGLLWRIVRRDPGRLQRAGLITNETLDGDGQDQVLSQ